MFKCLSNVILVTSRDIKNENITRIISTLKAIVKEHQPSNSGLINPVSIWPVNDKDVSYLRDVPSLKSAVIINLDTVELTAAKEIVLKKINEAINLKRAKADSSADIDHPYEQHATASYHPAVSATELIPPTNDNHAVKKFCMQALTGDQRIILERFQNHHSGCQMLINTKETASLNLLRVVGEETRSYMKSLSNPGTIVKFLKFIDLISRIKTAGVNTIWHEIKHKVENRFNEFITSDPNNQYDRFPANHMLKEDKLPNLSIFKQHIQNSNGYKAYCSEIIRQSTTLPSKDLLKCFSITSKTVLASGSGNQALKIR